MSLSYKYKHTLKVELEAYILGIDSGMDVDLDRSIFVCCLTFGLTLT